ncbi:MAG: PAS-domain containing protein, partial [Alphaproteobacteria bacterium]
MNREVNRAQSAPAEQFPPELLLPMLHNSSDGLILAEMPRTEGEAPVIGYVNKGFTNLTGYSQEEVIGQKICILWPLEKDPERRRKIRQVLHDSRPGRLEVLIHAKSGHKTWVELITVPLLDARGKLTHVAAIGRDMTAQKRREEALMRAEERFRALIDGSLDGFFLLEPVRDDDGRVVDFTHAEVNSNGALLVGRSRTELLGRRGSEIVSPERFQSFVRVLEMGAPHEEEFTLERDLDGVRCCLHMQVLKVGDAVAVTMRDISNRVASERKAQEAERRLRDAIERITAGFVLTDADDRIVLHNEEYKKLHPMLADLVRPGANYLDVVMGGEKRGEFAPLPSESALDRLQRERAQGNRWIERRLTDGRWLRISEQRTSDGGWVIIHSDITPVKRAEQRLRDAIDSLDGGFILIDADDRIVAINTHAKAMFSVVADLLKPGARGADIARAAVERGMFELGELDGETFLAKLTKERRRNRLVERHLTGGRWIQVSERKTADGGSVVVHTDITRIKHAELRLLDAIESINEGFILFDADDRVVLSNSRFRELYTCAEVVEPGLTCEELAQKLGECIGRPLDGPDDGMWIRDQLAMWRSPDATVIEQQLPSGRWVRASSHRTREGGLVSVHTDITGHMQREQALLAAKEEAESANRAKSEFLANTSHELRTPLNAIIGFSEIMGKQMIGPVGEPRYLEYANDIYESGTHLLDLINTILDTAKIEAGKYQLQESPVDLREVIDACLRQ